MAEPTKQGAELLVRYYLETVDYAQRTGDVKKLGSLSRPGCEACNTAVSGIRGIHKSGGFIRGGRHTIKHLRVTRLESGEHAAFRLDFKLHSSKQKSRASASAKLDTVPRRVDPVLFALSKDAEDGLLKIDFWQLEPPA